MRVPRIDNLPAYTYEEYKLWEGNWELIDGVPYAMSPAPSILHQTISTKITRQLDEQLEHCEQCHALLPVDWKINENTVVQPDNLVVCYQPTGNYITKAPTVIFEILSKSTAKKDKTTKSDIYEAEGVKYYIIVDPDDAIAKVYELYHGRYVKKIDATDETVTFDLGKCPLTLDFSKIWRPQ